MADAQASQWDTDEPWDLSRPQEILGFLLAYNQLASARGAGGIVDFVVLDDLRLDREAAGQLLGSKFVLTMMATGMTAANGQQAISSLGTTPKVDQARLMKELEFVAAQDEAVLAAAAMTLRGGRSLIFEPPVAPPQPDPSRGGHRSA
jgi:hypothetical protein